MRSPLLAAIAPLALLLAGAPAHAQMGDFPVPVEAATAKAAALDETIPAIGNLMADEMVMVGPEVDGTIAELPVEEGTLVEEGAVLARLDGRVRQAELDEAEARLQLARLNHKRAQELRDTGAMAKSNFDGRLAELRIAEAAVALAQAQLDKTIIRAPFAGEAGLRHMSPGAYVRAGDGLMELVRIDPIKLEFTVPETRAGQIHPGQAVSLKVDALPGQDFRGEVYAIAPAADMAARAVTVRARVPNPDGALKPGYFARVSVVVARHDDAVMVPEQALVPQGGQRFLYVVKDDGGLEMRPVQTGQYRGGEVQITQGLAAGETVVTAGQMKLHPGAHVQVVGGDAAPDAQTGAAP